MLEPYFSLIFMPLPYTKGMGSEPLANVELVPTICERMKHKV